MLCVIDTEVQEKNMSASYKSATIALAVLLGVSLAGIIAAAAIVLYRRSGISEYCRPTLCIAWYVCDEHPRAYFSGFSLLRQGHSFPYFSLYPAVALVVGSPTHSLRSSLSRPL